MKSTKNTKNTAVRPFLKWPGSKTRVMSELASHLPTDGVTTLVEPFVGSGAVFLNTDYQRYFLADVNPDLINAFMQAKNNCKALIDVTKALFEQMNSPQGYLDVRREFNATRPAQSGMHVCVTSHVYQQTDTALQRAAQFIFLNRHGFNGLMRYNRNGEFNVSYGKYAAPYFPETELLHFSQKANSCDVTFKVAGFTETLHVAPTVKTVFYCDPPYLAASESANFTQYHSGSFGPQHHKEMVSLLREIKSYSTASVVISGSNTEETASIYREFCLHEIEVSRSISCKKEGRKKASEVIGVLHA